MAAKRPKTLVILKDEEDDFCPIISTCLQIWGWRTVYQWYRWRLDQSEIPSEGSHSHLLTRYQYPRIYYYNWSNYLITAGNSGQMIYNRCQHRRAYISIQYKRISITIKKLQALIKWFIRAASIAIKRSITVNSSDQMI